LAQDIYQHEDMTERRVTILSKILDGLGEVWDWFTGLFQGAGAPLAAGSLAYWLFVGTLILVLLGLLAHILYTFFRAVRTGDDTETPALNHTEMTDPEELDVRARALAEEGNYVDASRALYRAALLRLEKKRGGRVMAGLTNTEYLGTFHLPWVIQNLRVFADLINWKWYRNRSFDKEDYAHCRRAHDEIAARLRETQA
jgi:hypothetical protein